MDAIVVGSAHCCLAPMNELDVVDTKYTSNGTNVTTDSIAPIFF